MFLRGCPSQLGCEWDEICIEKNLKKKGRDGSLDRGCVDVQPAFVVGQFLKSQLEPHETGHFCSFSRPCEFNK